MAEPFERRATRGERKSARRLSLVPLGRGTTSFGLRDDRSGVIRGYGHMRPLITRGNHAAEPRAFLSCTPEAADRATPAKVDLSRSPSLRGRSLRRPRQTPHGKLPSHASSRIAKGRSRPCRRRRRASSSARQVVRALIANGSACKPSRPRKRPRAPAHPFCSTSSSRRPERTRRSPSSARFCSPR